MPYSHVQFHGMRIDTFGTKRNGRKLYHGYYATQFAPSTWDTDAEKADFDKRLAVFQRALDGAWGWNQTSRNPQVLKVFMAPEFFFRGPIGAYSYGIAQYALHKVTELVTDAKWSDWFFVFGSVVCIHLATNGQKRVANMAPCGLGGQHPQIKVVWKKHVSGIDFIKKADRLSPNLLALEDVVEMPLNETGDQRAIFNLGARKVGVEICLDHHQNVRRIQRTRPEDRSVRLDIQLVPSAGMDVKVPSVVTKREGYIFNCDGIRKAADLKRLSSEDGLFSTKAVSDVGGGTTLTVVADGQDPDSNDVFTRQGIKVEAFVPRRLP
ncbi:hypothetical protein [Chondromyces apiculatus]|uniref:Uncharacterized protein n=1 Tax=Chondromyces apiculatus DSM 436 TaxID=1192034 RepID=A0A017T725_9BACT|nr:hypothetical protein [Chondromyces apiculatus]EYF05033.1 Hypothetical protein CAP_3623 [Chondromyces apiculatus DSM 436]